MTFLAERALEEHPTNAGFDALVPISGLMTDADRTRVLKILQTFGKKLAEKNSVIFNSDAELIATLEKEFPQAHWPAEKAAIASDPLLREYLERKVAIKLANNNPSLVQRKARQLKNALYYELRYGNAISIKSAAGKAELVRMKHGKNAKRRNPISFNLLKKLKVPLSIIKRIQFIIHANILNR